MNTPMPGLYWNMTHLRRGVARVRGRWVNALDSGGQWRSFSSSFVETPSGFSWSGGPAEYHIGRNLSDGATLISDNRFDIFDRVPITLPAAEFELTPIGGFNVAGRFDPPAALVVNYPHVSFANDQSQVWHSEAGGPGLHVRWTIHSGRAPRMTRELVVDPKACPQRDLSLSWDVRSPRVLALVRDDQGRLARPWAGSPGDAADVPVGGVAIVSVPDQMVADQLADELASGATETRVRRGSGIRPPLVWYWRADGTLVTAPATVRAVIQSDGETVRFTKTIPLSVIQSAAAENSYVVSDDSQTIYPDPGTGTTTCDGHVVRFGTTGYALRAGDGTTGGEGDSTLKVGDVLRPPDQDFWRCFLLFDLAAVTSPVTAATLSAFINTVYVGGNVRVTRSTTAQNVRISNIDFKNTYLNHDSSISDLINVTSTGWKTWTLDAAGVSYLESVVGGISKFSVRGEADSFAGTGGQPRLLVNSADSGADPYLEVTYGAGGGSGGGVAAASRGAWAHGLALT